MSGRAVVKSNRSPQRPREAPVNDASGIPYGHVPAYLPGSASLVEELDKELMIVLRDGRHLIGVSFMSMNEYTYCSLYYIALLNITLVFIISE